MDTPRDPTEKVSTEAKQDQLKIRTEFEEQLRAVPSLQRVREGSGARTGAACRDDMALSFVV